MFELIMQKKNLPVRGRSTKLQYDKLFCKTSKNSFSVNIIMFELIILKKIFLGEVALQNYKVTNIHTKLQKPVSVSMLLYFN